MWLILVENTRKRVVGLSNDCKRSETRSRTRECMCGLESVSQGSKTRRYGPKQLEMVGNESGRVVGS